MDPLIPQAGSPVLSCDPSLLCGMMDAASGPVEPAAPAPILREELLTVFKFVDKVADSFGQTRFVPLDLVPGLLHDLAVQAEVRERFAPLWPDKVLRLGDAVRRLSCGKGEPDFRGCRVALLAQWSPDGRVAPYVLAYLRQLAALGYRTVLCAGREPAPVAAWTRLCDAALWRDCPGYDFTSWKAALEAFPSLFEAEELLFTNDSVFGPVRPLAPLHQGMAGVDCDFWGLLESREAMPHLQSYYLVFRPGAIRHPAFAAFWDAVESCPDKRRIVQRCEIPLGLWLSLHGLRPGVCIPAASLPMTNANPAHYFWRQLVERYGFPFLKRDLVRAAATHPHLCGWESLLRAGDYDPRLVTF